MLCGAGCRVYSTASRVHFIWCRMQECTAQLARCILCSAGGRVHVVWRRMKGVKHSQKDACCVVQDEGL